jgi:DNA-binding IclR family transcriptional regulator
MSQVNIEGAGMTGAQAIRRALDVVRAVARFQCTGVTLTRIASMTGLSTSTAHRILRALTQEQLLRFDEPSRNYFLGLLAAELGLTMQVESEIEPYWRETIEELARETQLTTYLMARSDCEAVCLLCVQGSTIIRAMPMEVGQRIPLGVGAGSLAILASMDDDEISHSMAINATRLQHSQLYDLQNCSIPEGVRVTRRDGYAVCDATVVKGIASVGVPVSPRKGLLQLAISVSAVIDEIAPNEAKKIATMIRVAIKRRSDP